MQILCCSLLVIRFMSTRTKNVPLIQSLQFDQSQLAAVTEENEGLRKQVEQMEGEAKK